MSTASDINIQGVTPDSPRRKRVITRNVIIVGAGPEGLLSAILMLRRNEQDLESSVRYHVMLVDSGPDLGQIEEDDLNRHRSWMVALMAHARSSIQQIPGLYKDYIEKMGNHCSSMTLGIGSRTFDVPVSKQELENLYIDRNCLCAALARYLNEHFLESGNLTLCYKTNVVHVDAEYRCLLVRSAENGHDQSRSTSSTIPLYLGYDLLLGCDGIQSIVRNSFLTHHQDFYCSIQNAAGARMKSIHLTRPSNAEEDRHFFLWNCPPKMTSFAVPKRGGQINFLCSYAVQAPPDPDMLSEDPKIVQAYLEKHFTRFDLNFAEAARAWVEQTWTTTQQVRCNFYHSIKLRALLLGDAAHASLPNLGEGTSMGLEDAVVLNDLLDLYKDNWDLALPAFSKERVKEGNALTDLSFHTMHIEMVIRQSIRHLLNQCFPTWLVDIEPKTIVSQGMKLSEAFERTSKRAYIGRSRQMKNDMKCAHFEKKSGMAQNQPNADKHRSPVVNKVMILLVAVIAFILSQDVIKRDVFRRAQPVPLVHQHVRVTVAKDVQVGNAFGRIPRIFARTTLKLEENVSINHDTHRMAKNFDANFMWSFLRRAEALQSF